MAHYKRLNETWVMAGEKGTGKTSRCLELLAVNKKKHIIVDLQDHPSYRHLPLLLLKDIKRQPDFNCRIITAAPFEAVQEINQHIYNMNIVLEDAKRYINSSVQKEVVNFVINHKQHNLDIIAMFHSLRQVPPFFRDMLDKVVIFKTKDEYSWIKNKFSIELAEKHKAVKESSNPYEYDYIDL